MQIEINNRIIKAEFFGDIIKKYNIEVPNIQRILNQDKVNDIVEYQKKYILENNRSNFLGIINIHYVKSLNKYFLVDGQHRYNALQELYNIGHNINVFIEYVTVENYEELKKNYNTINKNTTLPEFPNSIDKCIPETAAMYFKQKYSEMWSKNTRANRPNIYFDYFLEALGVLLEELANHNINIKTPIELQDIVENYNNKLSNWNRDNFPEKSSLTDTMYNKCKKNNLYLGLFKHISDKYRYKWVKNIIQEYTGEVIKTNIKKKKSVPKKIKIDSWNKYIGETIRKTKCICCNTTEIDITDFHAGHIIAEKNGGLTTVENIMPICSSCNSSMGSNNMNEYINTYYPHNMRNFNIKMGVVVENKSSEDVSIENTSIFSNWITM